MFKNMCAGAIGIGVGFEETLPMAEINGFEGVDVPIGLAADLMDKGELSKMLDLYQVHGLRVGGWGFPVDWKGDEVKWRDGMAQLPRWAKAGQAVNSPWVPTWITPCSDDMPYAQNLEWHVKRLAPAARILRDHGCRLGLEFVGTPSIRAGKKYEFVYNLDQGLELCQAVGSDAGLLLDCWHWFTSGGTADDLQKLKPGDVVYVHVNDAPRGVKMEDRLDSDRTLPGETGIIHIATFLRRLEEIDFEGPVTAEPFVPRLASQPAERSAQEVGAAMQKIWQMAGL